MLKMEFNEKFLALRDVKRSLCDELKIKLCKVGELNKQLRIQEDIPIPELLPGEQPELRDHVTDEDIAAYLAEKEAAAESAAGNGNAMGTFGAAGDQGSGKPAAAPDAKGVLKVTSVSTSKPESVEEVLERIAASYPLTPLEQAQRTLNERRWVCTG